MKIEWKDTYLIHIKNIDCQHKQLIDMSSRLLKMAIAMNSTEISEEVHKLMKDLNDYADYHFEYEERLMNENLFSEAKEHTEIHLEFIHKIKQFEEEIKIKMDRDLLIEMLEFLTGWIAAHIMVEDKKYSLEFQTRKINDIFNE